MDDQDNDKPALSREQLYVEESKKISELRNSAGASKAENADGLVGLALSGGGIRSACFSLGVIKALGELDLWKKIDYVSSVSGGGYAAAAVLHGLQNNELDSRILRANKYIKTHGGILITTTRNIFLYFFNTILSALMLISLPVLFVASIVDKMALNAAWVLDEKLEVIVSLAMLVVMYSVVRLFKKDITPATRQALGVIGAIFTMVVMVQWIRKYELIFAIVFSSSILMLFIALFVLSRKPDPFWKRSFGSAWITMAFSITLILGCSVIFVFREDLKGSWIIVNGSSAIAFLFFILSMGVNANWLSTLRVGYRNSLKKMLLSVSESKISEESWPGVCRPVHLIGCFLQAPQSVDEIVKGRGGYNFIISPLYSGPFFGQSAKKEEGFVETLKWLSRSKGSKIQFSDILAASGAAIDTLASQMSPVKNVLIVVLNGGIGLWVKNWFSSRKKTELPWPQAFLNVVMALALHNERNRWLRISDGGHFDNLGLYELVARRCKEIVVVDAAYDPRYEFIDLEKSALRCEQDFGAFIEIADIKKNKSAPVYGKPVYYGIVKYSDGSEGKITYLKSCVSDGHSLVLRLRSAVDLNFPHEPTTNQFFDNDTVDCYEKLGYETAKMAFERSQFWSSRPQNGIGAGLPIDKLKNELNEMLS